MKLGKKSQSAIEYVQTYGWAILVVLAVGIVIWQMGILGRERINIASGFTTIQVMQQSIKYTASENRENTFTFMILNAGNIRLTKIVVANVSGDCSEIRLDSDEFVPTGPYFSPCDTAQKKMRGM